MIGKGGDQDRGGWSVRRFEDETINFTAADLVGDGSGDEGENHNMNGTAAPPLNEWVHIACVYDVNNMAYIYINGEVDRERATTGTVTVTDASVYLGTRGNTAGTGPDDWGDSFFDGMLDDVRFYDHALEQTKLESIMAGEEELPSPLASMPAPVYGDIIKETWATLSWEPGYFAASHDVYFGDNFDDVNNGTGETFQGNLGETYIYVGFPGFPFPDGLMLDTTYYWRIDEINDLDPNSPWKGDIWSFSIAPKTAYNPNPPDDAESVDPNVELSWSAGFGAILHTVYFGDDFDDVDKATGGSPQKTTTYDPGPLELEKVYYWRVDESDATATYKGNIWSFTTVNFLVVDDFEDYNDYQPDDIFSTWKDGYDIETNGALIGYDAPDIDAGEHFVETTIVHSGNQSMPYFYNNIGTANYSEAGRTLDGSGRDWTAEGIVELSLWFIGLPASVGSFVEGPAGTYTMTGSGADIWGTSDEFHFAFKQLDGIGSIIAKVESVSDSNPWAKAGVMIRDSLEPGSKHAIVCLTPGNGVAFQDRVNTGGDSFSIEQSGITSPHWVKLERDLSGDFTAYHSTDGSAWEMLGLPERIQMVKNAYIGLAVTAHNAEETCEAVFSNVTFTGTLGPEWTNQDIGIISNDAEPMYVAVSNTAGDPAVVYHDDPNAAQIDTWMEWVIPLQAFADQGVDLTDIDRIAIGFGTKDDTTTAGGSGITYFDDIRLYRPEKINIENFSFELPGTEKIKGWNGEGVNGTPAVDIPGWSSDTEVADSGVETGFEPTDGEWSAFLMSGDPSVWQLTDHTISDGDILELKVDARITWAATAMQITLYYDDNGVRVPAATGEVTLTDDMQEYTLSLSAADVPESVGKKIGIEFSNTSSGDSWIGLDNVRLVLVSE